MTHVRRTSKSYKAKRWLAWLTSIVLAMLSVGAVAPVPALVIVQSSASLSDAPVEESEEQAEVEVRVAPLKGVVFAATVARTFRVLERPRESFRASARSRAPPAASQLVPSQQKSRLRLQV